MTAAPQKTGIEEIVTEFLCDPTRSSMELPHLTAMQRKSAKKVLEQYPELNCESYGFGKERRLSVFKQFNDSASASLKGQSTFGMPILSPCDQDQPLEHTAEAVRNASTNNNDHGIASPRNEVKCVMDGPVCKLDLTSIRGFSQRADDRSTIAPSSCASDCSPASTFRGSRPLAPWFVPLPGFELEVRNTFVHFKTPTEDQRAVQTMPHSMFGRCLLEEADAKARVSKPVVAAAPARASKAVEDLVAPLQSSPAGEGDEEHCSVTPGTEVVIDGLSKFPGFNGLRGTVQFFDQETGRYNVLLSSPVCGRKSANVKRENLRLVSASESLHLFSEGPGAAQPLKLTLFV